MNYFDVLDGEISMGPRALNEGAARHILSEHNQMIEDVLNDFLKAGFSTDRLRIEHHPDCRTVITIDGRAAAEIVLSLRMT